MDPATILTRWLETNNVPRRERKLYFIVPGEAELTGSDEDDLPLLKEQDVEANSTWVIAKEVAPDEAEVVAHLDFRS